MSIATGAAPRVLTGRDSGVIFDPGLAEPPAAWWFDPGEWHARGLCAGEGAGRGSVAFVQPPAAAGDCQWAVRRYRRGGLVARVIRDHYWFAGAERTRVFHEFRVLHVLHGRGLPVPRPVAGSYRRRGPWYEAVLITERLAGSEPLSARLADSRLPARHWQAIGSTLRLMHDAGLWHADLNAHNLMLDASGTCRLIDFDRARYAPGRSLPAPLRAGNLARLARSLRKLGHLGEDAVAGRAIGEAAAAADAECRRRVPAPVARHAAVPVQPGAGEPLAPAAGWSVLLDAYRRSS